jgi:hypothetical protein
VKKSIVLIIVALLVLSSCERVFTSSPFDFLQRDPSTYSLAQLLTYADDALASGNQAAMAAAFGLLADSTDPETQLVAVELAFGAAGVGPALTSMVAGLVADGADPEAVVAEAMDGFSEADLAMLVAAADLLDQSDETTEPTAEQYAFAAIGLLAAAADDADGIGNLNPPPAGSDAETYVDQAGSFLDESTALLLTGGGSTDIVDGLAEFIP